MHAKLISQGIGRINVVHWKDVYTSLVILIRAMYIRRSIATGHTGLAIYKSPRKDSCRHNSRINLSTLSAAQHVKIWLHNAMSARRFSSWLVWWLIRYPFARMIHGNKYVLFIEERQNARHFIVRPRLYVDYMMRSSGWWYGMEKMRSAFNFSIIQREWEHDETTWGEHYSDNLRVVNIQCEYII